MTTTEHDTPEMTALYRERAHLVAFLAAVYPAVLAANDPQEPDWPIVYVTTPRGQLTWHLSPADLNLFKHVPRVDNDDLRAQWDGHTTEKKYQRLEHLVSDVATGLMLTGWRPKGHDWT